MDLALTLTLLSREPVAAGRDHFVFPGWCGPVIVHHDQVEPRRRATWLLALPGPPIAQRLDAALEAGLDEAAWHLLAEARCGVAEDAAVAARLKAWAATHLPPDRPTLADDQIRIHAADAATAEEVARGARDLRLAFDSLPWPRWAGPVVVVVGDGPLPAGTDRVVRPTLPMLRLPADLPRKHLRETAAAALARLYLDLSFPPPGGWPAWFSDGLAGYAAARARGEGPSPREMAQRRSSAGRAALLALLRGDAQDGALATALVAPLCHTHVRPRLPNLLEVLRHRADALSAIEITYGFTLDGLLAPP